MGACQVVASMLGARSQTLAETAARRAAFLDSVSRDVLPSLDLREIGRRVVALIVPRFADFAMIWAMSGDGGLAPVASTHAEAEMRELVDEGARAAVAGLRPTGLTYVVTQRQSTLYPDVSASTFERLGEAQRARAERLGIRTLLTVPLVAAGKTLGAMAWGSSSRHYRSEDLAIAEAVAERVGAAFENARLYEMARQAIAARDEFLVLAAHELRTPLTALHLYAHRSRPGEPRGTPADETARNTALARQVSRLSTLVERMCDAARIRSEGMALALESCELSAIVRERANAVMELASRRGCTLAIRAETAIVGRWDPARAAQLVDELLDNAIKFGAGKPVDVALDRDGASALLTVSDHGAGIPGDRFSSVFSPFERAVSREHFGGLGLGLFIAKAIAEAHGGSLEATSGLDPGTTMVARLPVEVRSPARHDIEPRGASTWSPGR